MKGHYGVLCLLLITSIHVYAHNVVGGVYADGFTIEGEIGFSNGSMARAGSLVKIYNLENVLLGEVVTDDEGYFSFQAKQPVTHVFYVDLGAGHQLTMTLPADELPESELKHPIQDLSASIIQHQAPNSRLTVNQVQLERVIAKQVTPLRKEIQELKEKSGLRDLLGGIGYIFGLLGMLSLLREYKLKDKS